MNNQEHSKAAFRLEYERMKVWAEGMGGEEKLSRRREQEKLNARERIDILCDPGSFVEFGKFAASLLRNDIERTPGDGKIIGFGEVDGRQVGLVVNDLTVLGASSTPVNRAKIKHIRELVERLGVPFILLGESSGARLPDNMGGVNMSSLGYAGQYRRDRVVPWLSAIMGPCYGSSALYGCMADVNIMVKGAVMGLSSPALVKMATSSSVGEDEIGGWEVHAKQTALADLVSNDDQECVGLIKNLLSFLPDNNSKLPPFAKGNRDSISSTTSKLPSEIVPFDQRKTYDAHALVESIVDRDSWLELKPDFARNIVVGLGRIGGSVVGIISSNPMVMGGALDRMACDKVVDQIVLCDSFNIPIVILVDQPGFLVGAKSEGAGLAGRVINWMNALAAATVPVFSVIVRKSYGQAYLNMGGGGNASVVIAWSTADVSFMAEEAAQAIGGRRFQELRASLGNQDYLMGFNSAYELARSYGAHLVIDPDETRRTLLEMLSIFGHQQDGVAPASYLHRLSGWATSA
jgi:acetyl-CoA carboxylase carboxyltransferase component